MEVINERSVLDFYLEEIKKDSIVFLKGKQWYKDDISKEIIKLRDETEMHNKIIICKNLWKLLFEASMSFIDPDRRGYDDVFSYFDEYVNFEELIFASDSFYRDHTMHCLWVYFLGEYLYRKEEFNIFFHNYAKENDNLIKIFGEFKNGEHADFFKEIIELMDKVEKSKVYFDPARCLSALTHDLGYPIKKIASINKNIRSMLPHFGIRNFDEFVFNYSDIHDNFIKDFLNLISYSFQFGPKDDDALNDFFEKIFYVNDRGIVTGINEEAVKNITKEEKEALKDAVKIIYKIKFNYTKHIRYSKDFENYQHGIMSAFLLFRKLAAYNNKELSYIDFHNVSASEDDFMTISFLAGILRSVTDHTSEGFQMYGITDNSAFLTFVDELEEFSRISRANQNRQYINEFCKSNIYIEDGYLNIDFTFDNTQIDNLDPEKAFKGRCKRFLTLFNISGLDENLKLKLRCIGKLPQDNNVYMLEIRKKYANITINDEEMNIPKYLKSKQFLTKEAYQVC